MALLALTVQPGDAARNGTIGLSQSRAIGEVNLNARTKFKYR